MFLVETTRERNFVFGARLCTYENEICLCLVIDYVLMKERKKIGLLINYFIRKNL